MQDRNTGGGKRGRTEFKHDLAAAGLVLLLGGEEQVAVLTLLLKLVLERIADAPQGVDLFL